MVMTFRLSHACATGLCLPLLALVASLLAPATSAHAQDTSSEGEASLSATSASPDLASLEITPQAISAVECGRYAPSANTFSCPFGSTSLGLEVSQKLGLPEGLFEFQASFGRGRNAALSLDRQMFRTSPATTYESSLATFGTKAVLFGGRLKTATSLAWSRNWEQPLFPSLMDYQNFNETSGFSHDHTLALTAIDRPRLTFEVEGRVARAGQDFRTGGIQRIGNLSLGYGDTNRLIGKLGLGAWEAKSTFNASRSLFSEAEVTDLELGHKGVRLGYEERLSRRASFASIQGDQAWVSRRSYSLDFDLFKLAPGLVIGNEGWSVLLPKQLRIEANDGGRPGFGETERGAFVRRGQSLFAMWVTPLGTTLLDVGTSHRVYTAQAGTEGRLVRDNTLMLVQNVSVEGWSLGFNLLSFRSHDTEGEEDNFLNYNLTAACKFKNGAMLAMEFGRDLVQFGGAGADFNLQDRSHRARIELDLSKPLQRQLANSSVHLTLAAQLRLNRSESTLRLFDEVIDFDSESFSREGILVSFGYQF